MTEDPFERSVRRAGMPARTGKPHLFLRDGRWWAWRPGYMVPVTASFYARLAGVGGRG